MIAELWSELSLFESAVLPWLELSVFAVEPLLAAALLLSAELVFVTVAESFAALLPLSAETLSLLFELSLLF